MRVDLHIHSTFSDGTESPLQITETCKNLNLDVFAITDHDTVSGLNEKLEIAKSLKIKTLKGIEFSAYTDVQTHILGYNFDENTSSFSREMLNLKNFRNFRAKEMKLRLKKFFDIEINDNDIIKNKDGGFGSMHIAKALINEGYVTTVSEAFSKYIGFGTQGFVGEKRIEPQTAVELITKSGGVAVLAHPGFIKCELEKKIRLIKKLKEYGLQGIEAYHSSHTEKEINYFIELAREMSLIVTGGSDRHGEGRNEKIGRPVVNLNENAIEVLKL